MRNMSFDSYLGPRLSPEVQKKRIANVIRFELTPHQQRVIIGYYLQEKSIPQLAEEFGVNKSTVWRTLQRAEKRMRLCLRY